jgi:MinD superfamily P-loop ATPase
MAEAARQLVVLSGKGGTGKTTVTAALAELEARCGRRLVCVDADVDAANLGIILEPRDRVMVEFSGGQVAQVEAALCLHCGVCLDVCRFDAITLTNGPCRIEPTLCEGCRACEHACPEGAIRSVPVRSGSWSRSMTRVGPLVHGELEPGRDVTGKLVTAVREEGLRCARATGAELIIIDGPPGIGCPVMATATGTDLALLVAEPGVAGAHDLRRVVDVLRHFGVPALACINKCDLNPEQTRRLEQTCDELGVPVVARLPFDPAVQQAVMAGRTITEQPGTQLLPALETLQATIDEQLLAPRPDGRSMRFAQPPGAGGTVSLDASGQRGPTSHP